jgi:hypothetical protein
MGTNDRNVPSLLVVGIVLVVVMVFDVRVLLWLLSFDALVIFFFLTSSTIH